MPHGEGNGQSYDSEDYLSKQVENLRQEVQELSREVELSKEIDLRERKNKKRNQSANERIMNIEERDEEDERELNRVINNNLDGDQSKGKKSTGKDHVYQNKIRPSHKKD